MVLIWYHKYYFIFLYIFGQSSDCQMETQTRFRNGRFRLEGVLGCRATYLSHLLVSGNVIKVWDVALFSLV